MSLSPLRVDDDLETVYHFLMKRLPVLFALFFLLSASAIAVSSTLDYWETTPKLWEKIRDRRQILVSAKNENGRTVSKGAGLVKASVSEVWAFATDAEKIRNASRLLKSFKWDTKTGDVQIEVSFLGFDYQVQGRATQKPDSENPSIDFEVLEGFMIPFSGELEIRSAKAQAARPGAPTFPDGHTLVRISGLSAPDRALSWPLQVAVEVVLQRTAGYLRQAVEEERAK